MSSSSHQPPSLSPPKIIPPSPPFTLQDSGWFTLSGADNPGIVHELTSLLARHNLSIDQMRTSQEEAPFGGATLFSVEGVANAAEPLASHFDPEQIGIEISDLGNRLNCDVDLEEISREGTGGSPF